jgi:ankyrin repeat protein
MTWIAYGTQRQIFQKVTESNRRTAPFSLPVTRRSAEHHLMRYLHQIPALLIAMIFPLLASETPKHPDIDTSIAKGDLADVKLHLAIQPECLEKGGRPNSRPPLEQALLRKKTDIVIALLEAGANPNPSEASKRTPLHLAIERNLPAAVTALIKAGAKPNLGDQAGWTPLHHAAAKNLLDCAKALLEGGADPMQLSELGGTPLHEAAVSGSAEIIQLLLDHKVDPQIRSKQGVTALDLARQFENKPAIELLEKQ